MFNQLGRLFLKILLHIIEPQQLIWPIKHIKAILLKVGQSYSLKCGRYIHSQATRCRQESKMAVLAPIFLKKSKSSMIRNLIRWNIIRIHFNNDEEQFLKFH